MILDKCLGDEEKERERERREKRDQTLLREKWNLSAACLFDKGCHFLSKRTNICTIVYYRNLGVLNALNDLRPCLTNLILKSEYKAPWWLTMRLTASNNSGLTL